MSYGQGTFRKDTEERNNRTGRPGNGEACGERNWQCGGWRHRHTDRAQHGRKKHAMQAQRCGRPSRPAQHARGRALWQRAQVGGWVDAERQPTKRLGTKAAKAVFANVMIETLNIPRPAYVPFEALWGETGLQNSYSSGIDRNVNEDLKSR